MHGKTRALFVDHTAQLGGAELSIARYLRDPRVRDAALMVLTPDRVDEWQLPPSVATHYTTSTAGAASFSHTVRELTAVIDQIDPECVIANSYSAAQYLSFVRKRDRRFFYFLRQEAVPLGLPRHKSVLNRLFTLYRFDGYLANSYWTADSLPAAVRKRRPIVISRPISGIQKTARTKGERSVTDPMRLLTLSRLSPWKGVHTAIQGFALLQDADSTPISLTVAGGDLFDEPDYSRYLRKISASLDVSFIGHQSDVNQAIAECDVLLCLSVTPEPFGQVIVQGMASGCVVIATNQGGPREIICDGENGFLVEPEAPAQVRDVILRLSKDAALFNRVSLAGLETVRQYSDEVTIRDFAQAIDDLCARTQR